MISVVIPTYNRGALIERAIRSVLLQDEPDWELLIVDNNSNDDTKQVVEKFLSDQRVRYFFLNQKGAPLARNYGLHKATGRWIIFLDSDDELSPNYFSSFKKQCSDSFAVYYGNYTLVSDKERVLIVPPEEIDRSEFVFRNPVGGFSSVLFSRELVLKTGGHDLTLPARQDADLYYRMSVLYAFKKFDFMVCHTYLNASDRISDNTKKRFLGWQLFYEKHSAGMTLKEKYFISQKLLKHSIKNKSIRGLVKLFTLFFR